MGSGGNNMDNLEHGPSGAEPGHPGAGRGHSLQGELQKAKGGPQGANQGGAPRGTSRLEPSHIHGDKHFISKHASNLDRNKK